MSDRAALLIEYAARFREVPFRAGKADCALFAAGWVKLATGKDHARGWRGKYRSLKQGKAMIRERGFADHVEMAASLFPEINKLSARVGDLAVVPEGDAFALGVVAGERIYVLGLSGVGTVPLESAVRAFRI